MRPVYRRGNGTFRKYALPCAVSTANDMYAAIDEVERYDRSAGIRKNKTRLEKRLKTGAFGREIPADVLGPQTVKRTMRS